MMKATQLLHNLGQSIWLDNITRELLDSGTLKRYIEEFSVTGLTSNPTIFDHAIKNSTAYDAVDSREAEQGQVGGGALLRLWRWRTSPGPRRCSGPSTTRRMAWTAGFRSKFRPCSPTTPPARLAAAKELHARAGQPNLFIKIPGTKEGLPAIEEAIFAGVPINVTLLFSREQYVAAAEAFLRGIERRIEAGLNPNVGSVASLFVSRWDAAVMGKVPESLRDQLGIAIAKRTYKAYRKLLESPRWQRASTPARVRNGCCGPAPEPRIPRRPTFFTSRPSLRRSP